MNTFCTPEENYRLFGAVSDSQLVMLIDSQAKTESISNSLVALNDALTPVNEDFLSDTIQQLQNVIETRRKGDLKDALTYILTSLKDIERDTYNAVEYSDDIIQGVISSIDDRP